MTMQPARSRRIREDSRRAPRHHPARGSYVAVRVAQLPAEPARVTKTDEPDAASHRTRVIVGARSAERSSPSAGRRRLRNQAARCGFGIQSSSFNAIARPVAEGAPAHFSAVSAKAESLTDARNRWDGAVRHMLNLGRGGHNDKDAFACCESLSTLPESTLPSRKSRPRFARTGIATRCTTSSPRVVVWSRRCSRRSAGGRSP